MPRSCTAPVTRRHRSLKAELECPVCGVGLKLRPQMTPLRMDLQSVLGSAPPPADDRGHLEGLAEDIVELIISDDPAGEITSLVLDLLEEADGGPDGGQRGEHLFCDFFEEVACALRDLLELPSDVIDAAISERYGANGALVFLLRALVKRAIVPASEAALAPLLVLHVKVCCLAIALCPDEDEHPSLKKNCGLPLFESLINLDHQ